jgi:phospholipid/cholesterol/gamma-HCH transport system substrate-binding protein
MEKTTGQKIRLGIFVIAGLVFFIIAVYFIGNKQSLFGKTFIINSVFRNVNGLQLGNNVRYSGINAGTVSKLELVTDTTILVEMTIVEKIRPHLRKDAIATIGSDGLVGSMLINIVPGKGTQPIVESGDYLESYSRISTTEMLNTLNVTNENAALLTSDLLKITQAINNSEGTLGMLVNNPTMAKNLDETIANLKTTSIKAVEVMDIVKKKLNNVSSDESLAGMIINDTATAMQFKQIITDLEKFSTGINSSLDSINQFIATANQLGEGIQNTKGIANAAIYDTTIVVDLKQTVSNLRLGTQQFNEVMESVKQSVFLRKYFNQKEGKKKK